MSWFGLAPYLLAAALGAVVTWPVARAPVQRQLADVRTQHAALREERAEALRLSALAAAAKLQKAQATGEAASARLAQALAINAQLSKEKRDAIKQVTDGRACLRERALRVLDGAAGITVAAPAAGVPEAPGEPAPKGAATATDSDIAGWIVGTGEQHEACRRQLAELIDWINNNHPAGSTP